VISHGIYNVSNGLRLSGSFANVVRWSSCSKLALPPARIYGSYLQSMLKPVKCPARVAPAWDSQWNSEEMEALWGCASQLWVLGRICVHGRPHLSFCLITLQYFGCRNFEGADWYPFCLDMGNGWESGGWVVGPLGGSRPKFTRDVRQFSFYPPDGCNDFWKPFNVPNRQYNFLPHL